MTGAKANDTRGEIALALEGEEYVLRPSYQAIKAFEAATGKGVVTLAQQAFAGELQLNELAAIAAECIRAWGRASDDERGKIARSVDADRVGELIMGAENGVAGAMGAVAVMLSLACSGGYTGAGERKPATSGKAKAKTPAAG